MSNISASAFSDTKAHYELLDGLRGVAALMVIWYHVFEGCKVSFSLNKILAKINTNIGARLNKTADKDKVNSFMAKL